jgi:DNA-binding winged helix-turn-helix (wHTH) protein/Tol biopolymer transport system component
MSTQPASRPRLHFGPFEFDPATGELRKHRSVIRLQGQPLRILAILVDRPDEIISRLEMQRQLWPGATSGDFDHGLNAAINKLRQILNDSADQPRYIETVPGHGYRFIAPLHDPAVKTPIALLPSIQRRKSRMERFRYWLAGLAGLVLILVVAWGLRVGLQVADMAPLQFAVTPPPGYSLEPAGPRRSFELSPDGKAIAYSALDESGRFHLFLREFNKLESQLLPDGLDVRSVFWSEDGQSIYYSSSGKLRRYGIAAHSSVVVADALAALSNGISLPGGRMLVSNNLRSVLINPGSEQLLPQSRFLAWPEALPGSKYFLSYVGDQDSFRRRGVLIPTDGQGPDIALGDFYSHIAYTGSLRSGSGYLLSVQEGALLARPFDLAAKKVTAPPVALVQGVSAFSTTGAADFSVSSAGVLAYTPILERSQFFWVDRAGTPLSAATPSNLSSKYASLSPDGRNIATVNYDVRSGSTKLWIYSVDTKAGRELSVPFGNRNSPIWSPDSRSLLYMRSKTTPPKLAIRSIEPTGTETDLPEADFMIPTSWSRDGRYVLYNNTGMPLTGRDGQSDIFLMDLHDQGKIRPFIQTPFNESSASFSPAMDFVAFVANDSGKAELYLQALAKSPELRPVGERFLIAQTSTGCVRWRADGKELYYLGAANQVFAVGLQLSAKPKISKPQPLFKIQPEVRSVVHGLLAFDVASDGKRFLIPTVASPESHAMVVVRNWEEVLLKQR